MHEPDPNNPDHNSPHSSEGGEPGHPGDRKSPVPESANADSSHSSREDDTAAGGVELGVTASEESDVALTASLSLVATTVNV